MVCKLLVKEGLLTKHHNLKLFRSHSVSYIILIIGMIATSGRMDRQLLITLPCLVIGLHILRLCIAEVI